MNICHVHSECPVECHRVRRPNSSPVGAAPPLKKPRQCKAWTLVLQPRVKPSDDTNIHRFTAVSRRATHSVNTPCSNSTTCPTALKAVLFCFIIIARKKTEKKEKTKDTIHYYQKERVYLALNLQERGDICTLVNGDVSVEKSYVPSSLHTYFTLACTFFGESPTSMSHA